jgi:hypothetical protein
VGETWLAASCPSRYGADAIRESTKQLHDALRSIHEDSKLNDDARDALLEWGQSAYRTAIEMLWDIDHRDRAGLAHHLQSLNQQFDEPGVLYGELGP